LALQANADMGEIAAPLQLGHRHGIGVLARFEAGEQRTFFFGTGQLPETQADQQRQQQGHHDAGQQARAKAVQGLPPKLLAILELHTISPIPRSHACSRPRSSSYCWPPWSACSAACSSWSRTRAAARGWSTL